MKPPQNSPDNGSNQALNEQPTTTDRGRALAEIPPAVDADAPPTPAQQKTTDGASAVSPPPPKVKSLADLYSEFLDFIITENPLAKRDELNKNIAEIIQCVLAKHKVANDYTILLMFDPLTLMRQDTDKVYQALNALTDKSKPIALIINSGGGEVDAGYLISKLCREFSPDRFIAVVPRRAKSAATLICCGADQIHMGSMSELGPIDPQVEEMPALGLKNAVQHLLELAAQFPGAADVLAKYLNSSLKLIHLGYYERVAESAAQYAERLLNKRKVNNGVPHDQIAKTLVYRYKDHGFVIDTAEAETIFGPRVIFSNTPEYYLGNDLYNSLSWVERMFRSVGYRFYFYGSPESAPNIFKKS
jgi:hypothetical protein